MKTSMYPLCLSALLVCGSSSFSATVKVLEGADRKERVVLENSLVRLQVDPGRGARVDSFHYKPWGDMEIVQDKNQQGLFVDHFWQEYWPGQFWEARFEHQIVSEGPEEASVKFSCLSQNKGIAQVTGILLEKTISLKENERKVNVSTLLTNKSSEGRYIGYWLQNVCWLGGDLIDDQYFRPSKRGLSQTSSDEASPPDNGFVREPQAGWTAAIDGRTKTGLVYFMDYNYLWFLYNCTGASTTEWQYDAVAIPPGKTWQTEVSLVPVSKLDAVCYASDKVLVGASMKEDKAAGRLEIVQTYLATADPLKTVEVLTGLEALLSHQNHQVTQPERISDLGFEPQTITVSLPYDTKKREPAVVRLTFKGRTATGKPFTESTELWYPGSVVTNVNPTDGSPLYSLRSPRKEKALIKPDRIVRIVRDPPQVLFLKGLLSPSYRLETAIRKQNPLVQVKEGYAYVGVFGPQLDFFPYDYDALMSYDLVILGDLSAACVGEAAMEMLKDYCENGGNLLVLGGPFAYGNGGYKGTVMDQMLPVLSQGPFDLQAARGSVKLASDQALAKVGSLNSLKPGYMNQVKAKPEARALLTCGGWPFLITGNFGAGRVCCVTGTPLGRRSFCDTEEWQEVLQYLLKGVGLRR